MDLEHARLTAHARPAGPPAAYLDYVARCRGEGLVPLSQQGWRVASAALTQRSMEAAWATSRFARAGFGFTDDKYRGLVGGRINVSSSAWRYQRTFNERVA